MKTHFLNLLLLLLIANKSMAQQTMATAGGTATGPGGTATFTIGQPIYKNKLSPAFYIEEGVQHPIVLNTPLALHGMQAFAKCEHKNVLLNWVVVANAETEKYSIEKSSNGVDWKNITEVNAAANTEFEFLDESLNNTNCYYRIIEHLKNNKQNVSATLFVLNCNGQNLEFNIYPNPTTDGIYISSSNAMAANECELLDAQGKIIFTKTIKGNTNFIDMKTFTSGNYLLRIIHKNKQVQLYKIIKN
jgi:Secretion system C-terminal sorting domain